MEFFPIILHRSTSRGTLMTEWCTTPLELEAAIKDLLQASTIPSRSTLQDKINRVKESIK